MKGRNYRNPVGQAYTREKFIHGAPPPKISKFTMGDASASYEYELALVSQGHVRIRHNALEACRIAANKVLLDGIGETGYMLQLKPYPHLVLRENKMIATAGADRLQEGMRRSFGKPIGRAAEVHPGQQILLIRTNGTALSHGREALRVASTKLPMKTRTVVEKLNATVAS